MRTLRSPVVFDDSPICALAERGPEIFVDGLDDAHGYPLGAARIRRFDSKRHPVAQPLPDRLVVVLVGRLVGDDAVSGLDHRL